ncbi:neprilysin-1-like [Scaptodrosophila lebanonensis]|uniref:Neprilysin-1-like n=1 Tax=Drosophila lebanonensis TaxID=7225 RepID=A0A6J2T6N7_DROLE|nr:neprilysin-1-like [Scaptodrosophila lebanonensis]
MLIHKSHTVLFAVALVLPCVWSTPPPRDISLYDSDQSPKFMYDLMREAKVAEMESFMNPNVDPCDNFYEFACGKWDKTNRAEAPGDITTGLFEHLSKALNRKLFAFLKGKHSDLDTPEDKQVKNFYESCTRLGELKSGYKRKLMSIINEFGTMPVLEGDKWNKDNFDWLKTIGQIAHTYNIDIIIDVDVGKDFKGNETNVIYIGGQEFPLGTRPVYVDEKLKTFRDRYRDKIANTMKNYLGIRSELADQTATEHIKFEIDLARGMDDDKNGRDMADLAKLTTVADMQRRYMPIIDVEALVRLTLNKAIDGPIYEYNAPYQENVMAVMRRTPLRIVANYIFFSLIDSFIQETASTPALQDANCIDKTKQHFAKNLDNMLYRRYNTKRNNGIGSDTAADIELIWDQLKSTFTKTLNSTELDWISPETRSYAIEKLKAMKLEINSYANENFTEEMDGLNLTNDDLVENLRLIGIHAARQTRNDVGQKAKPLEAGELLSYTPANILIENVIKVPVALLQPFYLWDASYPNALKFGTLATLIGHELIHCFDDAGRKFDKSGSYHDWWDEKSAENFLIRQECFSNQYSEYVYNKARLPKSISQSENVADNGGVRLAFKAYLEWYSKQTDPDREKLPKFNYTSKQLFFISYAQVWCNDAVPQARALQTSTDQHVPGMYRVIGPLSNFEEFGTVFDCAVGTQMNRENKCKMY